MRFAIFSVHLAKVLHLPRKSDARSYEVLHLSRKIISANLKIWCSKMQPLSGNQRPDLLTSLINIFCTAPAMENTSLQILFKCPTPAIVFVNATKPSHFAHFWQGAQSLAKRNLNVQKCSECEVFLAFSLANVLRATTARTFSTCQLPKVLRTRSVFSFFTCKCASRHNRAHFFDMSTFKSAPNARCF